MFHWNLWLGPFCNFYKALKLSVKQSAIINGSIFLNCRSDRVAGSSGFSHQSHHRTHSQLLVWPSYPTCFSRVLTPVFFFAFLPPGPRDPCFSSFHVVKSSTPCLHLSDCLDWFLLYLLHTHPAGLWTVFPHNPQTHMLRPNVSSPECSQS